MLCLFVFKQIPIDIQCQLDVGMPHRGLNEFQVLVRCDIGYDAGKKIKGRKRHILVDTLGMLLKVEVHSAGIQDRDGAALVFDKLAFASPSN